MELEFKEVPYKNKKISFTIKEKEVNGISSNHMDDIISTISLNGPYSKSVLIDHKKIEESAWNQVKEKIVVVPEWI